MNIRGRLHVTVSFGECMATGERVDLAPVLVFRIAWMDAYRGVTKTDRPVGGGSYVAERGFGLEAFNFAEHNGRYYGFGEPKGRGVNLTRLGSPEGATELNGVTVIWVATHPSERGQRIVGWYTDAVVFSEVQKSPSEDRRLPDGSLAEYLVSSQHAVLLDRDERIYEVPRATKSSPGIGQSNIWYPNEELSAKFIEYIEKCQSKRLQRSDAGVGAAHLQDTERRLRIERFAMGTTVRWFQERGYDVVDVSSKHLGWDLEARRRQAVLRIEVKGTSLGLQDVAVEVTPNEYAKMTAPERDSYRLCVVCSTEQNPELLVFAWSAEVNAWTARNGRYRLELHEIRAARLTVAKT